MARLTLNHRGVHDSALAVIGAVRPGIRSNAEQPNDGVAGRPCSVHP